MLVRDIHLHGALGEEFSPRYQFAVKSPAEAMIALTRQVPGFSQYIRKHDWQIILGDVDEGRELSVDELTFQSIGRPIHFVPVVAGAKKNNGIGKVIAGIALIAITIYTGGTGTGPAAAGFEATIAGTSITVGQVALLGASLVLSGVSSMLAAVPEFASTSDSAAEKSSSIFQGPVNTPNQGGPVPLVYGRTEVGSTVISAGISTEQVEVIIPTATSGGSNSQGNAPDPDVGSEGTDYGGGVDDGYSGDVGGAGGGGDGASGETSEEAINTLRSRATARLLDLVSEGPIRGLVDGAKSIKIGGTPLMSENGKYNFSGINWQSRVGQPTQDYMKGYPEVESEIVVGLQVTNETPIPVTITDPLVDAVRVTLSIPALLYQNQTNGNVEPHSVSIAIEVQSNGGGYSRAVTSNIGPDKCTATYERAYRIDLPEGGAPWDVRMVRLSEDTDEIIYQDDTYFARYTEITDVKMEYPHCAYFGFEVDAEEFGDKIQERSYLIDGIEVQVPSNYDWVTRSYATAIWDGTFHADRVPTSCPAWIVYDIVTNDRYGLGSVLADAGVSKWDLYELGKYCDEYVPDGFGGTEPRFTFNGVLNTQDQAIKIIAFILAAARGSAFWGNGGLFFTQDRPKTASRLVTRANVVAGEFNYSGTAATARHNMVLVAWHDPDDQYKASAIEVVEDKDGIHRHGLRKKEPIGWGCTSRGQAHRLGDWILETEKHQTQTVTYVAGQDHADAFPGEILEIADPAKMKVRHGGRLFSALGTTITLDAPVTLLGGEIYYLNVQTAEQTIETRTVTNLAETTDVLTIDSAFTEDPPNENLWTLTSGVVAPKLYQLIHREEVTDTTHAITAIEYDPDKFARVEQGLSFDPPSYSAHTTGEIIPPTGLGYREYLYEGQTDITKSAVLFSWELSKDTRVKRYDVQYRAGQSEWQSLPATPKCSVEILETNDGDWSFRVRSIDGLSRKSEWVKLAVGLVTLEYPPDDVQNFEGAVKGDLMNLSLSRVPNLDLHHYVLKFIYDGAPVKYSSGIVLDDAIPKTATSLAVPAMSGTYMIKAVDTSGSESVNAAMVYSTVASLFDLNVVEELTQAPLWTGVKTDMEILDGKLVLASGDTMSDWSTLADVTTLYEGASGSPAAAGTYELPEIVDQGRKGPVRITTQLDVDGVALDGLGTLLDSVNYRAFFEVSYTDDDPSASPVWSDWSTVVVGDYDYRAFKFLLNVAALDFDTRPIINQANVIVDVFDRYEKAQGITCPVEGLTVDYSDPFKAMPVLNITASNLAGGDNHVIDSESNSAFTIRFIDSTGAAISRNFNYVAAGYGYGVTL